MEIVEVELCFYYGDDKSETEELMSFYINLENDNKLTLDCDGNDVELDGKNPLPIMIQHVMDFSNMTQFNSITIAPTSKVFNKKYSHSTSYSLKDIVQMRKNAEFLATVCKRGCGDDCECHVSWDWGNEMVYSWFIRTVISPLLRKLCETSQSARKLRLLKGMECPVLRTPLDKRAFILQKCKHFISFEAWDKIDWVKTGDEHNKKCPLCRCSYNMARHEWSPDIDDILELLPELEAEAEAIEKLEPDAGDLLVKAFPKPERIPMD
jgi:hypothetical protein